MVHLEEAENHAGCCRENLLKKFDVPIHHLDFAYVEKCNDGRELEKIYQILKSGQEGHFPDLLRATENRLRDVKPNSKYVRKSTPVLSRDDVEEGELKELSDDLNQWLQNVNKNNEELEGAKNFSEKDMPEVRKTRECAADADKATIAVKKRIGSTDYASWDKFDAETEILKMDLEHEKKLRPEEPSRMEITPSERCFNTKAEAIFEANREKEKGNEFFKAGEYKNALRHYTNGITCFPTATLYTNRAFVHLKLKNYEKTVVDCEAALKYEPENLKANLRMALAFQALNQPDKALRYAEKVISINPNITQAQQVAEACRRNGNKSRNVRFKIVESETVRAKPPRPLISIPGTSQTYTNNGDILKKLTAYQNLFLPPAALDDEDECTEQHLPTSRSLAYEDEKQIYLKIGTGRNYLVVDNRNSASTKRRNANFEATSSSSGRSKIGKNSKMKTKSKKSEGHRRGENNEDCGVDKNTSCSTESLGQNGRLKCADAVDDDVRARGEPHFERQPTVQTGIHMPYTFLRTWQSARRDLTYTACADIMRNLDMERICEVMGNKIDTRILSDVINCLYRHFTVAGEVEKVYSTLTNLCRMQRFDIEIMFLSESDKNLLRNLAKFLEQHGRQIPDSVAARYGLTLL